MNKNSFSGILLLIFAAAAFALAAMEMSTAYTATGTPTGKELMQGQWAARFERKFNEILPVFEPSRAVWGKAEYAVFGDGRKGVVVGKDGWLFTDEEFSCLPYKNLQENIQYITDVKKRFQDQNIKLAIVLVPAKARVYQSELGSAKVPLCRENVYNETQQLMKRENIVGADLLLAMQQSNAEPLYLKTDTHWTPAGARLAAQATAQVIDASGIKSKKFETADKPALQHEGDLMRYLPGVRNELIKADTLAQHEVKEGASGEAPPDAGLFGDDVPEITLVGTSYSANPLWNFEGFLKTALQADILNMADEGLGPFTVMDKYLASDVLKQTPPKIVIWEIPERYLTAPHDINKKS